MEENLINERFNSLEIKLSYMEDFVNQLQNEVVLQSKVIAKLEEENKLLSSRLKEIFEAVEADIPNRKPPHY